MKTRLLLLTLSLLLLTAPAISYGEEEHHSHCPLFLEGQTQSSVKNTFQINPRLHHYKDPQRLEDLLLNGSKFYFPQFTFSYPSAALILKHSGPQTSSLAQNVFDDFYLDEAEALGTSITPILALHYEENSRNFLAHCCSLADPYFWNIFIGPLLGFPLEKDSYSFVAVKIEGTPGVIGIQKTVGESTFLATKTIYNKTTGRPIFFKGGIYQIYGRFRAPEIINKSKRTPLGYRVVEIPKNANLPYYIHRFYNPTSKKLKRKWSSFPNRVPWLGRRKRFRTRFQNILSSIDTATKNLEADLNKHNF